MKREFNAYLASLGASAPVKSLTELRIFNLTHLKANAIRYGQSNLDISDELDVRQDRAKYEADRAKDVALAASTAWQRRSKTTGSTRCCFQGGTSQGWRRVPAFLKSSCRSGGAGRRARPESISCGVHAAAVTLLRRVCRSGMQRASPDRDRVRVRTGDEAASAA